MRLDEKRLATSIKLGELLAKLTRTHEYWLNAAILKEPFLAMKSGRMEKMTNLSRFVALDEKQMTVMARLPIQLIGINDGFDMINLTNVIENI